MRHGDSGDAVRELQETLQRLGYELPRWGADGHLGDETFDALKDFARDHMTRWPVVVPPDVLAAVEREGAALGSRDTLEPPPTPWEPPVGVQRFDMRGEMPEPQGKARVRQGRTVLRSARAVTGIVIHQTATPFSVSSDMIRQAGGDADLALRMRVQGRLDPLRRPVACHGMVFRRGWAVLTRPLRSYVYHGNGLNSSTLGIEFEGRYPGLEDDPSTATLEHMKTTWGGKPQDVTDELVAAGRELLAWMVAEGRAEGMPIQWIYAHRQSSADRRSDPGSELWRRIVLEFAVPELGLETRPQMTTGDGAPIPLEWDPAGKGHY